MIDRTLPVHHSCPKKGCDICQRDWPCARLVRTKHDAADKPTDQELYDYWISTSPEFGCADPVGFARAVLIRWGTPANTTREESFDA